MTPLSTRHVPALLALLALALPPVVVHGYLGFERDDCRDPHTLMLEPDGVIQPVRRGEFQLKYRVRRSSEPVDLYLRPTRFLEGHLEIDRSTRFLVQSGEVTLPVEVLYDHSGSLVRIVGYTFVYDSRPVEHPFVAQLASALPQIFTGSLPLTLYLVETVTPRDHLALGEQRVQEWLAGAWQRYAATCRP